MAISNIQTVTNSSIQLLPPAPVSMDQRDIRSSMITGGQYQHDETLTKWQDWAQKALHVQNDPLLLLLFHDYNIEFIIKTARKKVSEITGTPTSTPDKEQLIELLLLKYENLRGIKRKDLRSLLLKANNAVVSGLVNKLLSNYTMYNRYYNDKVIQPQPIPLEMPRNVHLGGSRALKGGKPFIE